MGITENEKPRYTAEEFYKLIPETSRKVELINGEIVSDYPLDELIRNKPSTEMLAGASRTHQIIAGRIYSSFDAFIIRNKGKCETFDSPFDVEFDEWNVVQPDVLIVCDPDKVEEYRVHGAPDLVVEVLSQNKKRDIVDKFHIYANGGVREYWIVDPFKKRTHVYKFNGDTEVEIYPFDQPIPVGIWDNKLEINISELLGW